VTAVASLEQALEAVEAGDFDTALDGLLDAWSHTRQPRLADLIDRVSLRVAATRPPPPTRGRRREEAWRQRATSGDAGELGVLLETFADASPKALRLRMRVLLPLRSDPRIGRELAALMLAPRHSRSAVQQWLPSALALLDRHFDPRTADALARVPDFDMGHRWRATPLSRVLDQKLRRLTWNLEHPAPWERELFEQYERIDRALPALLPVPGSERLWQVILDAPEDPSHLQVYGDFLLSHGDPRGEFIALQLRAASGELSPDGQRRMNWLERTHAPEWLHDIGWAIVSGSAVFERGFVKHIRLRDGDFRDPTRLTTTSSWATIRSLANPPFALLRDPAADSLTALECTQSQALGLLERGPESPNIERLTIHHEHRLGFRARAIENRSNLPNLREIVNHVHDHASVEDSEWIWRGPLGRELRRLELVLDRAASEEVALHLRALRAANPTIERVEIDRGGERWCLHRGEGRWTDVELISLTPDEHHYWLGSAIQALQRVDGVRLRIADGLAQGLERELLDAFEH
jgi:uncharacterized protein (TIGR02996 family)